MSGGRVEPEETVDRDTTGEVKEETGLDFAIVQKVGEYHEQGVQDGVEYD